MSTNRNGKNGPAHMAPQKGRGRKEVSPRRRREPLRDNYTYEEPRGGRQEFEDVTSYSSSRKKKIDEKELERQRKGGMSRGKKAALIVAAVLVLLIAGGAYYVFGYVLKDLSSAIVPMTKEKKELGIHSQVQTDTSIKNIALFGLDARDDKFEGRSDAIMILTVDNKHGSIKMTSILRDSNVSMKQTDADGNTYYIDDKITHAYVYGGPELAVQTINRNFSLDIEDYVTVNFIKMAEIIDACGGVKINVTYDEMNEINTNLGLQVNESSDAHIDDSDYLYEDGDVLLNGNQAVAYARIRHLDSDDMRASRQQTVLKALLEQARGKSKLEYPELIRKLIPMCKTSLDFSEIVAMVPIMLTDFTIETLSVPGEDETPGGGINSQGGWVYLYDLEKAALHINKFIYEEGASATVHQDDDVRRVSEIALTGGYSSSDTYSYPNDYYNEEWSPSSSYHEESSASSASEGDPGSYTSSGSEGEVPSSSSVSSSMEDPNSSSSSASSNPGYDPGGDPGNSSTTVPGTDPNTDPGVEAGGEEGGETTGYEGEGENGDWDDGAANGDVTT